MLAFEFFGGVPRLLTTDMLTARLSDRDSAMRR